MGRGIVRLEVVDDLRGQRRRGMESARLHEKTLALGGWNGCGREGRWRVVEGEERSPERNVWRVCEVGCWRNLCEDVWEVGCVREECRLG